MLAERAPRQSEARLLELNETLERRVTEAVAERNRGKGSGLGLPQVYGFAQQSGGQITINSEVSVGTTVTLLRRARCHNRLGGRQASPRVHRLRARMGHAAIMCCWSRMTRRCRRSRARC